jgi:hypothetical protein
VSESKPLKKAADAWKAAEKEKADFTGTSGGNRGRDSGNTRDDLYKRFGLKDGVPLSVFIQIHPGKKNPVNAGWQKITLEDTLTSPYQSMLETAAVWGNVGVLLGPPSNGLCAIDCDINDPGRAEKENELLLDLSPKLKQTIAVRRLSPHCQTFVRILGDYPKGIFVIKHRDGTRIGEFRAGGQSVISGWAADNPKDPKSPVRRYIWLNPENSIIELHWSEIQWPNDWILPWMEEEREARREAAGAATRPDGAKFHAKEAGRDQWWRNYPGCNFDQLDLPGLLRALGVEIKAVPGHPGWYSIACPWIAEHTPPNGELDTVIFPPGAKGADGRCKWWGLRCVHEVHCGSRTLGDLIAWCEGQKPGIVGEFCALPELVLPSGSVSFTASSKKSFEGLAPLHQYFVRGRMIVEIGLDKVLQDNQAHDVFQALTPAALQSRIEEVFKLVAWRRDKSAPEGFSKKPALLPHNVAVVFLESKEAFRTLPAIRVLSSCPVIAGKPGELKVLYRGYHEWSGGIYVTGGPDEIEIPSRGQAIRIFRKILSDYQFVTESDRSRAIASFISPALRAGGLLEGSDFPVDIAEANESQSGKTYRLKMVCAVYGVVPYTITKRVGGVGSLDESFSSAVISGVPFVLIDNLRDGIYSQIFESSLRGSGYINVRVPHRGEVQVPTGYLNWMLSSNSVQTGRELANRSIITRISKQKAGYKFREYEEGDVLAHIKANRAQVLGAIFAVIIEWDREGRPRTGESRHEFRAWAGALDWIVQNLFGGAPLIDGHLEEVSRVSDPALSWLRLIAIAVEGSRRLGVEFDASGIVELGSRNGVLMPGVNPSGDEYQLAMQAGRLLARAFGSSETLSLDRYQIRRTTRKGEESLKGDKRWIYQFEFRQTF